MKTAINATITALCLITCLTQTSLAQEVISPEDALKSVIAGALRERQHTISTGAIGIHLNIHQFKYFIEMGYVNLDKRYQGSMTHGEMLQIMEKYPKMEIRGTFHDPTHPAAKDYNKHICQEKDSTCYTKNSIIIHAISIGNNYGHRLPNWFMDLCKINDTTALQYTTEGWTCTYNYW